MIRPARPDGLPARPDERDLPMITTRSSAGKHRPVIRLRLLATAAAPLALAGAVLTPATAAQPPAHQPHIRPVTASPPLPGSPSSGTVPIPGLSCSSCTVTLITGDKITLTQTEPGRYITSATSAASGSAGSSTAIDLTAQTSPTGITSIHAFPQKASALMSSGQLDEGLFDVAWLAAHGDTGARGQIPVTIQYTSHTPPSALAREAASLPGTRVLATLPASSEATVSVAAADAAAFWGAVTARPAAAPGPAAMQSAAPGSLSGGITSIWLTGHRDPAAASPHSQDGQLLYTVTETITRKTGPVLPATCAGNEPLGYLCISFMPFLLGLAGPGQGNVYNRTSETCVSEEPGQPLPVCTAWQVTYTVPAGVYFAHAIGQIDTATDADHTLEKAFVEMDIPQFTVTGDTSITMNADQATPVTFSTPRPGSGQGNAMEFQRSLPDGNSYEGYLTAYGGVGVGNFWAVPTLPGEAATIGNYHFSPQVALVAPEVTATVTSPERLSLHPLYPCATAGGNVAATDCEEVTRFSGRQTLQLVNAVYGTASDFSKIDARGKLALIQSCFTGTNGNPCAYGDVLAQAINNAQQAGAAGVLWDAGAWPTDPAYPEPVPLPQPLENPTGATVADLPFAEIDNAEGTALLGLLAKGPVTVTVTDSGTTPYAYHLDPYQEAQIPASLHYTIPAGQLAEFTNSYHYGSLAYPVYDDSLALRLGELLQPETGVSFVGPATMRDYYWPLSPDVRWELQAWDDNPNADDLMHNIVMLDHPGSYGTLGWEEPPFAPGPAEPWPGLYQTLGDGSPDYIPLSYCIGCRQGNTFYPFTRGFAGSADPVIGGTNPWGQAWRLDSQTSIHLYNQAGQEIPDTPDQGVDAYTLPPQQARYRLGTQLSNSTTTITSTWDFTSAQPSTEQRPVGTICIGSFLGVTAPCQADPLVFLRYDAGLSLHNTITPGAHQLQVTGYHQDPSAPPVTSLKLWTSTDGGTTWQPAQVHGGRGGVFTATYTVPASGTNGYVSIKAQAVDSAGNDITQEIDNAYSISTATSASTRGR
jgi:hypothetical protein